MQSYYKDLIVPFIKNDIQGLLKVRPYINKFRLSGKIIMNFILGIRSITPPTKKIVVKLNNPSDYVDNFGYKIAIFHSKEYYNNNITALENIYLDYDNGKYKFVIDIPLIQLLKKFTWFTWFTSPNIIINRADFKYTYDIICNNYNIKTSYTEYIDFLIVLYTGKQIYTVQPHQIVEHKGTIKYSIECLSPDINLYKTYLKLIMYINLHKLYKTSATSAVVKDFINGQKHSISSNMIATYDEKYTVILSSNAINAEHIIINSIKYKQLIIDVGNYIVILLWQ
jgi:hypothetical protein